MARKRAGTLIARLWNEIMEIITALALTQLFVSRGHLPGLASRSSQ
jgi:hypothetical protein